MNVCVIGGGASGLVSAVCAAQNGDKVKILELRDRVGKKILATGNGKCNMTNADMSLSHYHGLKSEEASRALVSDVFNKYSKEDVVDFFEKLGILISYNNGYAYPYSQQASSVLDVLRFKLEALSVDVITDCTVDEIKKDKNIFNVYTDKGRFKADKVILSCGSRASLPDNIPDGYNLAVKLGHSIIGPLPALVPITCKDAIFKSLAGIRTKGKITLFDSDNTEIAENFGELQLAQYGVSGIPAFMISYQVSKQLKNGKKLYLILDFMPDISRDDFISILKKRISDCPYKNAENLLIGLLNKNLALALIKDCGIDYRLSVSDFNEEDIVRLADKIKSFRVHVSGTKQMKDAQVCAGGVDVSELNSNLESKFVKGLYFAGEMIDVHGDCGGYNLQWAFSSGMVCGYDKN